MKLSTVMRIASLLPSATDIVAALDLTDSLVGRTHECDWPPEVHRVPVLTRDELATSSMTTREIHDAIESSVHSGSSIYGLDAEALRESEPDLILTQELCEVCAVSYTDVAKAARLLEADVKVLSLEPRGIDDILDHIQLVADMVGVPERGESVVAGLRSRLEAVQEAVSGRRRPTAACLEWMDPLFSAGHWVPEQVWQAGAQELLGVAGEHSREIEWSRVTESAPDYLVLLPCGHSMDRAEQDLGLLEERPNWKDIPAVQLGQVWAVDGPAHFNRPGPRVVRGVEVLTHVFHGVGEVDSTEARQLTTR